MLRFVSCILGLSLLLGTATLVRAQSGEAPPVLTTVAQVKEAQAKGDSRGRPAQVTGVVTYVDPYQGRFALQDKTGGMLLRMVSPSGTSRVPRLHPGQRVEARGLVASPEVGLDSLQVEVIGEASLPEPERYSLSEMAVRAPTGPWIEASGVVRRTTSQAPPYLVLTLSQGTDRLRVRVLDHSNTDPSSLLGARLRVRGVYALHRPSGGVGTSELQLFVPSGKHITVQTRAREISVRSIADVKQGGLEAERVRVRGTIQRQSGGMTLLVADTTGTIPVQSPQRVSGEPGDSVEVTGFLSTATGQIHLRDAVVRRTAKEQKAGPSPRAASPSLPTLTAIKEIRRLSAEEARKEYPVRVEGVVTYADPVQDLLFVQDRTAGIFVFLDSVATQLKTGRRVALRGVSVPGDFAPSIQPDRVRVLGEGQLPTVPEMSLREFFAGRADAQWVEVDGTVQALRKNPGGQCLLTIDTGVEQFEARFPLLEVRGGAPDRLVGAEVRVRGVGGTLFNDRRQLVGVRVFVPGWEYVEVLDPGPSNLYAVPRRPIHSLLNFSVGDEPSRVVRVEGTVTHRTEEGNLYVQDETGAVLVNVEQSPSEALAHPGDRVEAVGFEASSSYNPVLTHARYRTVGTAAVPRPLILSPGNLLDGRFADRLVQLEARLLKQAPVAGRQMFTMRAKGHVFNAYFVRRADSLAALEAGSRLRLTGIYKLRVDETGGTVTPRAFELLLRDSGDVTVVEAAPWWTWWHTLGLLGGMVVVILGAVGWGVTLRREVRKQTQLLREREKQLKEAKEEAERMNRLKSAFLANMSHEIRTPLTSILGFAEAIGEQVSQLEERRPDVDLGPLAQFSDLIEKSGQRLLETLDAVLNLSKLEAGEMDLALEPLDLAEETRAAAELFEQQAEDAGIDLHVETDGAPIWARVDEGGLQIALRNLVSNAIKYTESGGEVWARAQANGEAAQLEVEDTGIGMDPEAVSELFEPFQQESDGNSRDYEGTGLGLAVTKRAVNQMNGSIDVETEKGEGSRFILRFPLGKNEDKEGE